MLADAPGFSALPSSLDSPLVLATEHPSMHIIVSVVTWLYEKKKCFIRVVNAKAVETVLCFPNKYPRVLY